jgi:HEAT repeat protein
MRSHLKRVSLSLLAYFAALSAQTVLAKPPQPEELRRKCAAALLRNLKHANVNLRIHSAHALHSYGQTMPVQTVVALTAVLREDHDLNVRLAAASSLGAFGEMADAALDATTKNDPDPEVRLAASLGGKEQRWLSDNQVPSLERALMELGIERDAAYMKQIPMGYHHPHPPLDSAKLVAAAPTLVPRLGLLLEHKDARIRLGAALLLTAMNEQATPARGKLLVAITDKKLQVRLAAWRALLQLGAPDVALLLASLNDPCFVIRQQAAYGLAKTRPARPEVLAALINRLLKDPVADVARWAAETIGELKPEASSELLVALGQGLKSRYWQVQESSANALGALPNLPAVGVRALVGALRSRRVQGERSLQFTGFQSEDIVSIAVLHALGKQGTRATGAVLAIKPFIADPQEEVRQAASEALTAIKKAETAGRAVPEP